MVTGVMATGVVRTGVLMARVVTHGVVGGWQSGGVAVRWCGAPAVWVSRWGG
jgi:hypothetical protein